MSYERQYYTNGDVLDARQMNHMETGIKENSDNIDKHSEDIATKASAIKEKASGEVIVVTDSAEAKPLGLAIDGKSEQNQYSGKNLVENTRKSGIYKGVTFVINEDGTAIFNGTATEKLELTFNDNVYLEAGKYVLNGCPSGGSNSTYRLACYLRDESGLFYVDTGSSVTFEITSPMSMKVYAIVNAGVTISNLVFKPMISLEGGEYEPYVGGKPSPSTEYKQDITNTGKYDEVSGKYAIEVKGTEKNRLENIGTSSVSGNINSVVNSDGTMTLDGTATHNAFFVINEKLKLSAGNYIVSGFTLTQYSMIQVVDYQDVNKVIATSYTNGGAFTLSEEMEVKVRVRVNKGDTLANHTIEPMIRPVGTDGTYEPYKETTSTVLLDEPLMGIEEVTDRINFETKKRINRFGVLNVAECDVRDWGTGSVGHDFYIQLESHDASYGTKLLKSMCNKFIPESSSGFGINEIAYRTVGDGGWYYYGRLGFRVPSEIDTVEKFKEYVGNDCIVIYERITPITEEIDIDLGELTMFYPTTILSNDCNANMEVTYIADTKAYVDKKITEVITAML